MIKFNNAGFTWLLNALVVLRTIEYANHSFLDCSLAKRIWFYFSYVFGHFLLNSSCKKNTAIHWWSSFKGSDQFNLLARLLPSLLFWELWLARNRARFDSLNTTAIIIIGKIKKWLRDLNTLLKPKDIVSNISITDVLNFLHISRITIRAKRHILVKWILPPLGILKLNIDNASKGISRPTSCGILRSNNCSIIIGFSCFLEVSTNTLA